MWKWLQKTKPDEQRTKTLPEWQGAPTNLRTKTYSAETGYVYQYLFAGYRDSDQGRTYLFRTTRTHHERFAVTIRLENNVLSGCQEKIRWSLSDSERYAMAKMTLFALFDRESRLENLQEPYAPDIREIIHHLQYLGRL